MLKLGSNRGIGKDQIQFVGCETRQKVVGCSFTTDHADIFPEVQRRFDQQLSNDLRHYVDDSDIQTQRSPHW